MAKKQPTPDLPKAGPKSRNKGIRGVKVADLVANPLNHRVHDAAQQTAFEGVVDEIDWYGYPDVYESADGTLVLIDGELRLRYLQEHYGKDGYIDVNVTDYTEEEARVALLTHDPISAMAATNADNLQSLLDAVKPNTDKLDDLLGVLADQAFQAAMGVKSDQAGEATGSDKGEPDPSNLGRSYRTISLLATDDQHDAIMAAVTKAKEKFRLDTTVEALAQLCDEWKA